MTGVGALILAASFMLCEAQGQANDDDHKVVRSSAASGCCDVCSLASVSRGLGAVGEKASNLAEKVALLEAKLQNTDREVSELRSLTGAASGRPQVAFSAALRDSGSGDTGPFTAATPLKYKRVFANVGSCYNPSTGVFTAMAAGVYFFRFSMFNNLNPVPNSVVSLMKNGERLASVWDTSGSDGNDMGSNAAVVPLSAGDAVYVELQPNRVVYDDSMNYNTFSGFLLFAT